LKHSKSSQRSEPTMKRTKARGPVQRDAKEVLAEVLGKLTGKLEGLAVLVRMAELAISRTGSRRGKAGSNGARTIARTARKRR
jgi:hypothetical protein